MMINFLKQLYKQRYKEITVILLGDGKTGEDNSFKIRPNNIISLFIVASLALSFLFVTLIIVTPIGSLLSTKDDALMRIEIEDIFQRVNGLQDSLMSRDQQLNEMKNVIRLSLDTTLITDDRFGSIFEAGLNHDNHYIYVENTAQTASRVNPSGIVFSNMLNSTDDFPSFFPVDGTHTREYDPINFHFGIDIATNSNEIITSIADGTVVNASWTINDGYVLTIQHAAGILSVYKHCSSVTRKSGDIVLKGDIIGTTGDIGLNSTGPHLHLEIWKDGISQDPELYLIR
jgi:murein DD-endopeptidase MepM/ murein hydrolase activator NlpD